ncbi:MAG: hypothetical protein NZT61_05040 [Deltaproteobacteria bacterium]|nr:hypothetical protein [Deltaproteobacteria bacterium]
MIISDIKLFALNIPFKTSFSHASKTRTCTETLICVTKTVNHVGFGEGCPRDYVTGEDYSTAKSFLLAIVGEVLKLNSLNALKKFVKQKEKLIDRNPAAWCAIETALLDVLGKERRVSVYRLLTEANSSSCSVGDKRVIRCTAVLGIQSDKDPIKQNVVRYHRMGFVDFKIKVSGKLSQDLYVIKLVEDIVPTCKIRIDANNLWENEQVALDYLNRVRKHVWAVEEPLKSKSVTDYKRLHNECGIKIILDETFTSIRDVSKLEDFLIPNLRISKLGGLIRTIEIARHLTKSGKNFILGCHVGETSILTACQLIVARMYSKGLLAFEGGFSSYLLETDIASPSFEFSFGGLLKTSYFKRSGLGLEVDLQENYTKLI